jgi:DNA recombination protein RmuC
MDILILVSFVILTFLLVLILVKLYTSKADGNAGLAGASAQMLDLKNELNDLKTKQLESQQSSLTQQQQLLQQMMNIMNQNLNSTKGDITNQLANSSRVINDIHAKLGSLETTTKNIQDISKDISSLQNILQSPKLRGGLGEFLLEELLKQALPRENFGFQHSFRDGTKVDAIIKLGENLVPVDSKFPLESFQRLVSAESTEDKKTFRKEFVSSVKKRIDEIAKYINPAEGTLDFAMMYIPAENVYYEIIVNDSLTNKEYELFRYAMEKHVIPVSPNSFYAYLMAISFGLKGLQIEQSAKTIRADLSNLQAKFKTFFEDYAVVGKHLNNAVSKFGETTKSADKFNDQIDKITGQKTELIEGNL